MNLNPESKPELPETDKIEVRSDRNGQLIYWPPASILVLPENHRQAHLHLTWRAFHAIARLSAQIAEGGPMVGLGLTILQCVAEKLESAADMLDEIRRRGQPR